MTGDAQEDVPIAGMTISIRMIGFAQTEKGNRTMADREKVVKGIQCRLELKCNECPYTFDDDVCDDCDSLFLDVLELLKEQEEVKPKSKSRHGECPQIVYRCGNCNEILYRHYKHCPACGKAVKWDGID